MKVSIITATYNSERTIKDTISSVKQQTHKDIEHIIIDGASTDKTINLLDLYGHQGPKLSEADNGIYHAMNKGVSIAGGDIIGILNSDDFYSDSQVVEKVVKAFESSGCDAVYGDLEFIDNKQTNKVVRKWIAGSYDKSLFYKGWMPPHPTVFIKKEVYEKYGLFNLKFKSSSDYELLLRLMLVENIKVQYIPKVLVQMRTGGQSNKSLGNRLKAHKEDYLAWLSNGISPRWYTLAMKPLSKIRQFKVADKKTMMDHLMLNNLLQGQASSDGF
ncbi:glycosyltransferase family 2 protein [Segetibacter sp.]|jgi:glycosyltransferase involved in cell wall biosynthesis|uniref:glycosyltransferase family 2 protein n=1 Tax=Segetibacter sp. TaxID=2231182 RepID=UPI002601F776|nr:glycosyltransferase family 2 protein [Segetibacter sp.]MCW3079591.1 glycosyltransferase [Segetibacter sp.]